MNELSTRIQSKKKKSRYSLQITLVLSLSHYRSNPKWYEYYSTLRKLILLIIHIFLIIYISVLFSFIPAIKVSGLQSFNETAYYYLSTIYFHELF